MQQTETIFSEEIYRGRIFTVSLATVREDDTTYTREIISHPGSAVVLPVFADATFALVRQYRHPAQKYLLELPAGSLEYGENPEIGARRELEEEIGVRAGKIEKLTEFYVSPGFLGEKMHLFLATELTESKQNLENDEILTIEKFPLAKIPDLILNGTIEDAKTMIGLSLAAARYNVKLQ